MPLPAIGIPRNSPDAVAFVAAEECKLPTPGPARRLTSAGAQPCGTDNPPTVPALPTLALTGGALNTPPGAPGSDSAPPSEGLAAPGVARPPAQAVVKFIVPIG